MIRFLETKAKAYLGSFDFIVAPAGNPADIEISVNGFRDLRQAADGAVVATTDGGEIRLRPPLIYQAIDGSERINRAPVCR